MTPSTRIRSALVAALAGAVGIPLLLSPAQAVEVPSVPGAPPEAQDAIDQVNALFGVVPPEVDEVVDPLVDDAVAEVLAQLVGLDVDGIAQAQSQPGRSQATAVDVGGVTIGESTTTKTSSRVVILRIDDNELLTKEGTPEGGEWGGDLAAAGQIVDAVNDGTCTDDACLVLVPTSATAPATASGTRSARFALLSVRAGDDGITVLPAEATTIVTFGRCTDLATAFPATGSGALALATIIGPKVVLGGVFQTC